jgi:hypothetical protein
MDPDASTLVDPFQPIRERRKSTAPKQNRNREKREPSGRQEAADRIEEKGEPLMDANKR